MKTPMQELIEWVRATLPMDLDTPQMIEQKIESMLEKEKHQIVNAYTSNSMIRTKSKAEEYYNETYGGNK
jgi:hypothetical protein